MKTLFLIRHDYTESAEANQRDFDRGLTDFGVKHAPSIGLDLVKKNDIPELIVSSEAKRAKQTAIAIAETLQLDQSQLTFNDRLYLSSPKVINEIVLKTEDSINRLAIVCHNPGISTYGFVLTEDALQMEPGSISKIQFDVNSWQEIFQGLGKLIYHKR
jgi:phosphohistidine phosphatase